MPYDNSERQERQKLRQQREDLQGNRLLVLFCVAALGLVLLTTCQTKGLFKYCTNHTASENLALVIATIVGVAILISGVVWALIYRLRRVSKQRVFGPSGLISVGFCLALSALFIAYMDVVGYRLSFLLVAIFAGLFICKMLFPLELFVSAIFLGGGAMVTYLVYKLSSTTLLVLLPWNLWKTVLFSALGALAICETILVFFAIKKGKIATKRKEVMPFGRKFGFGWPIAAILFVAAALLVAYFGISSPAMNVQMAAFALYGIAGVSLFYAVWHIIRMI